MMRRPLVALLFVLLPAWAHAGLFQGCGEFILRGLVAPGTSRENFDLIVAPETRSEARISLKNSAKLAAYAKMNVKVRIRLDKTCSKTCTGKLIQFLSLLEPDEEISLDISRDLSPTHSAKCETTDPSGLTSRPPDGPKKTSSPLE